MVQLVQNPPVMRAAAALLLVLATGCADDMTLTLVRTQAASDAELAGIDSDREGGLWLAYRTPTFDYYEIAEVRVVHVDSNGTELARFTFHDTHTQVNGLAFTGDAVWVNYNNSFSDDNRLRKLDPQSGAEIGSFATEVGIVDLASRGDTLLLSYMWNQVITLDRTRGGQLSRTTITQFPEGGTQRGIAVDDAGIWLMDQESDQITLVDDAGTTVASATLPGASDTYDTFTDQLAWDGESLVLAHHGKLHWFEVTR